jgi:linoleoyl-CoA desaturase
MRLEGERLAAFARELDALHRKYQARVGEQDLAHVRAVEALARRMVITGRVLIHLSVDPVTFAAGVTALWIGKQLRLIELGHSIMHGCYDRLGGAVGLNSKEYRVDAPVDEEAWRHAHNVLHHSHPNVLGKDPDARFGTSRLNQSVPWKPHHRVQLLEVAFNWLNSMPNLNAQVTGLIDLYVREAGDEDVLADRSWRTKARAHWRFLRKTLPYLAENYLLYPALAGPFFGKVLFGNLLADTMRNAFSAVAIYCGHIGEDVADFPRGFTVNGRAEWYLMQIEATSNFEVHPWLTTLVGALDRQIEHHLFPKLPPNRLREMAPEVRALCEKYAVPYRTAVWSRRVAQVLRRVVRLSKRPAATPQQSPVEAVPTPAAPAETQLPFSPPATTQRVELYAAV